MADTHLQVNHDGTTVYDKTKLISNDKEFKRNALTGLFSRNNWSVESIDNPSGCLWKIVMKNTVGTILKIKILFSSIRDEARQSDEFKTQFGGKTDFSEIEEGWINIPLGVYLREEDAPLDTWIFSAFFMEGINFLANPSFRGVRTKGLQLAQSFGLIENDTCIIFRPEFVYYVINRMGMRQSQDYKRLFDNQIADVTDISISYPQPIQQIFFGAPGVGKSHHLKSVYKDETDTVRITFHPETDYSSFIGCYKPQTDNNEIVYKFQGQAFTDAYIGAWKRHVTDTGTHKEIFLVIEEINRGNCAQIFGDMFQLLDRNKQGYSDYSIRPDKDLSLFLKDSFSELNITSALNGIRNGLGDGEIMLLPPNFNILATMNTSDQSLFPIDSAFKRRWDWVYMPIVTEPKSGDTVIKRNIVTDNYSYDWGEFLEKINARILTTTQSEDKQLGFWFVKPKSDNASISANDFVSKVIFFLWNDIYKDFGEDSTSIFNFADDGNPAGNSKKRHSFRDFTKSFNMVDNALVEAFLRNLNVTANSPVMLAQSESSVDSSTDENSN